MTLIKNILNNLYNKKHYIICIVAIIIICIGYVIGSYNNLISHDEAVKQGWGNLKRRWCNILSVLSF